MNINKLIRYFNTTKEVFKILGSMKYLKRMYDSYGGHHKLISLFKVFAESKKFKKYEKYKKWIDVSYWAHDVYNKTVTYYKDQKGNDTYKYFRKILKVGDDVKLWNPGISEEIDDDTFRWLLENPKIDDIELEFYDPMDDRSISISLDNGLIMKFYKYKFIICKYKNDKMLIGYDKKTSTIDYNNVYTNERYYGSITNPIRSGYIRSLDYTTNILTYTNKVGKRKRVTDCNVKFATFDYEKLKNDIIHLLENNKRGGYILAGNPGTGKTSALLKLENDIRDFPVVYITAQNIASSAHMNVIFNFIYKIGPCLVMIEEIDSLGLGDKNKTTGALLSYIDNSREKVKAVFITTINDSSKLDPSLVRAGRFGTVVDVPEPRYSKEVYEVMKYHYTKEKGGEFIKKNYLSFLTYWKMINIHKFTQAQYCEIINNVILKDLEVTNKTIVQSYKEIINSEKTLLKYNRAKKKKEN